MIPCRDWNVRGSEVVAEGTEISGERSRCRAPPGEGQSMSRIVRVISLDRKAVRSALANEA